MKDGTRSLKPSGGPTGARKPPAGWPLPSRSASARALVVALWLALALHALFLLSRLLPFVSAVFEANDVEMLDMDGEALIPIDLDLTPPAPEAPPEAPPAPPPPPDEVSVTPAPPKPPDKQPKGVASDAGAAVDAGADGGDARDAGGSMADAGRDAAAAAVGDGRDTIIRDGGPTAYMFQLDAGPVDTTGRPTDAGPPLIAAATPDAGPPLVAAATPDAGAQPQPTLRDPLAVAGGPARAATTDANVQVLIASDKLRKHELGPAFGRLLTSIPEWRSFFDGTGLDPIRDFDHLLLSGPQFRDTRKVVAVLDYNVPERRVRAALDTVVARSRPKGEWLTDLPFPAARARADRGDRVFALLSSAKLLVVMPAEGKSLGAEAKLRLTELKKKGRFNRSSAVGIVLHLLTPRNAFRGGPVDVPESIQWLRLYVTPLADGGVDLALEALDGSPALAARHAAALTDTIESFRKPDLGVFSGLGSVELFQPVKLEAQGAFLHAKLHVTRAQVRYVMAEVEKRLEELTNKRAHPTGTH